MLAKLKIQNHIDYLQSFGTVLLQRAKSKGMLWVCVKTTQRIVEWLAWFLLLPIAILYHQLGFRRLTVFTDRIGHLAGEIDCFEKLRQMGRLPGSIRGLVLAPPGRVANSQLLAYWRRYVTVVTNPIACRALAVLAKTGPMVHNVSDYLLSFGISARYYEVNAAWGNRPPLLTLTKTDQLNRSALLSKLGIPADAWFVCFHNREGGFSPIDESIHSHRNADIENYLDAMRFIVDQGGWCIRLGDPSMKPLATMARVIDYAHHPLRSEEADILLCASCRFFVGTSSGLFLAASVFGVRCALTNMIPTSTLGFSPADIAIPKLLRRSSDQREIPFPWIFGHALSNYRTSFQFNHAGIVPIENSGMEILGLVQEMYGTTNGTWQYDDADELRQQRFKQLLQPHHYGYGAASRVGTLFLREHRALLKDMEPETATKTGYSASNR